MLNNTGLSSTFAWFAAGTAAKNFGSEHNGTLTTTVTSADVGSFKLTPYFQTVPTGVTLSDNLGDEYVYGNSVNTRIGGATANTVKDVTVYLDIVYTGSETDQGRISDLWDAAKPATIKIDFSDISRSKYDEISDDDYEGEEELPAGATKVDASGGLKFFEPGHDFVYAASTNETPYQGSSPLNNVVYTISGSDLTFTANAARDTTGLTIKVGAKGVPSVVQYATDFYCMNATAKAA